jgi:hypothetical protein
MTRAKSKKSPKDIKNAISIAQSNLNNTFRSFDKRTQDIIISFFNLHNTAALLFDMMPQEAKDYTTQCVELSQELNEKSE